MINEGYSTCIRLGLMSFNYILFHVPKGQILFRHFKLVMIEYEFESAFLLRIREKEIIWFV